MQLLFQKHVDARDKRFVAIDGKECKCLNSLANFEVSLVPRTGTKQTFFSVVRFSMIEMKAKQKDSPLLRILKSVYPDGFGDEIKDYKSFVLKRGKGRRVTIELPNPRTLSKSLHFMPNGETR